MKKILFTASLLLAGLAAAAQPTLLEKTHGLIPGNPNPMINTSFSSPGAAGAEVTWDFSGLPQKAGFFGEVVDTQRNLPPEGIYEANTCLVEGELEAFMTTSDRELKVRGLRTGNGEMVRVYNQAITKMVYPFTYGDKIEGETTGKQRYSSGYTYDIRLKYSVTGDAYGTLILPGSTLKNVLRVVTTHSVAYSLEANAGTNDIVTYRWYVKEHRFPVLSLIFQRLNGKLYPLMGAYNPIVQLPETVAEDGKEEGQVAESKDSMLAKILVTPNPFQDNLKVSYELKGTANVTIAIYNMMGGLECTLMQSQQQEGAYTHSFSHQVQNLSTGSYIIRVEAAGNVLSQQILKVK